MATSSHVSLAFTCSNNGTNFYVSEGYGNIGSYTAAGISEFTLPACMSFKVVATNIDASDLVLNGFIASDRT